jgi:flavin reductase (DIM6/NTAB) family NADH-FMN oxidoreductase RutF
VLAQGAPPRLAGLVGPDTDFAEALQDASRSPAGFVVHVLADDPVHRRLAQHFAGVLPVPDGQVTWVDTPRGPALAAVADRLWCASPDARPFGWSLLVEAEVVHAEVGPALPALLWHRGRFIRSAPA